MVLTEAQMDFIEGMYNDLPSSLDTIEDIHENIMDMCMDNEELFDLSEDEDGDLYEEYSNLIWEYLSEK